MVEQVFQIIVMLTEKLENAITFKCIQTKDM